MILIVDDEVRIANILKDYLKKENFDVEILNNGNDVIAFINEKKPELVLLDIMLPGIDGITLCKKIKAINDDIQVILVSAKDKEIDRINGFETGADDYVCKPFSPKEVVARVKVRLKKYTINNVNILNPISNIKINLDEQEVIYNNKSVTLTPVEFKLLVALAKKPNIIVSRDRLLDIIYDDKRIVGDRTIDTHIKNVRKKFNYILKNDELFKSVYKRGYKLL